MNDMHKIIIVGVGLALGDRIARLFPEAKPGRVLNSSDRAALAAADAKRQRRIERNKQERNA